ncbi:MAG: hypothetical protein QG608_99 [Actinomycetota bacterium]|nr:hypothetical protein [Actinomycetota bacterium]
MVTKNESLQKDKRLQLRVDEESKHRLTEAARVSHLSLSTFVLQAALQEADRTLADREVISLSPAAAEAFAQALARPAHVNERLKAALSRPTQIDWLD